MYVGPALEEDVQQCWEYKQNTKHDSGFEEKEFSTTTLTESWTKVIASKCSAQTWAALL